MRVRVYRYDRQGFAQPAGFLELPDEINLRICGEVRVGDPPIRFEVLLFWDKHGTQVGLVPIYHYDEAQLAAMLEDHVAQPSEMVPA